MTGRIKIPLTMALWLANVFFWLFLIGFVIWRLQAVLVAGEVAKLRIEPVSAPAWPLLALPSAQARNPFDPAGTPWHVASSAAPVVATGQLRGIIVLPGVSVALTDKGAVKPGESLTVGRLVSVKAREAVVQTPSGLQALTLPGASRPTLRQLNQANKPKPSSQSAPPVASNQGR